MKPVRLSCLLVIFLAVFRPAGAVFDDITTPVLNAEYFLENTLAKNPRIFRYQSMIREGEEYSLTLTGIHALGAPWVHPWTGTQVREYSSPSRCMFRYLARGLGPIDEVRPNCVTAARALWR